MNFKKMPEMKWIAGKSTLALIFRDDAVDAAWVEQSLLGPAVRLMERLPRSERLPELLSEKLSAAEKTPACVRICLPRSMVMQRTLQYPPAVQDDLDQMIGFEAVRHVPLSEAERRIAYTSAPLPDGKQLGVNLLAARRTEIAALTDSLTAAGIPVDEVSSLSSLLTPPAEELSLLRILVDEPRIELALYVNGLLQDSLLLEQTGPDELVDAVRRLSVRHRELLGAEGIGRIVCSCTQELSTETVHALEAAFGLHIHPLELPEMLTPALASFGDSPVLAEALCAAAAEPPPSLNLIDRSGRKVPLSRRTLIVAGLCVLLAAELLIGGLVRTFSPAIALRSVEKETAGIRRKAAPIQTVKNQNRDLRAEIEQLDELGRTRVSTMEMLKVLSETLPEDTYLQGFAYVRGDEIRLRGKSKEPDKLPHLLLDVPFVSTIEESDIGEKEDEYYSFRLSAALRSSTHE
ncbi:MAG: hypothetical protein AB7E95_12730 [Kiritimatiellales bacterium]